MWRSWESSESSGSDGETVRHAYEVHSGMHERVIVEMEGKPINFIVDTGSSSMIMTKETYLDFNKNANFSLNSTDIKPTPYASDKI